MSDAANRPPDDYEQQYMGGQEQVLFRDKARMPWWFSLVFLVPVLAVWVLYFIGGSKPAPLAVPLIITPVLLGIWLLFSVLRITVTKQKLIVQYGLFGPTIPIENIV